MTRTTADLFLLAYKYGNLSEAAKAGFVSRTNVSKAISDIEAEYDAALFTRTHKGIEPTEAATQLYYTILRTNQMFDELKASLHMQSQICKKTLHIGVMVSSCFQTVKVITGSFKHTHPELLINIRQIRLDAYYHELISGSLDAVIACIASSEQIPDFLKKEPICHVVPKLVLQKQHPLISGDDIEWNLLKDYPLVSFADTPDFLSEGFLRLLNPQPMENHISIVVNDLHTVMDQIENHNAVGILPSISIVGWDSVFTRDIFNKSVNVDLCLLTRDDSNNFWKEDLCQTFRSELQEK